MRAFLIAMHISIACISQENDSLLFQIESITNDTEKVNLLYQHGFNIRNSDPESALEFAQAAEIAALKSRSKMHVAKSYNLLGILSYKRGDYTKALSFQKEALAINRSIKNETGAAINLTNLGNIYSDINQPSLAESFYLQALKAYNLTQNTKQIARCLLNIGVLKYSQKQLHSAIKQFEQTLTFATQIGDHDLMASSYNNIGTILRELNKPDSALIYLEESLKIRQQTDNEFEMADSYNNIANVYIVLKNFKLASQYIFMAEEVCHKYGYEDALIDLYHTRSVYYEAQNDFREANTWLKKHFELRDSLHSVAQVQKDFEIQYERTENYPKELSQQRKNNWLLFSVLGMLIIFPLLLIRLKR
jgi:tetratricopeptide (TPR) repeat protein